MVYELTYLKKLSFYGIKNNNLMRFISLTRNNIFPQKTVTRKWNIYFMVFPKGRF